MLLRDLLIPTAEVETVLIRRIPVNEGGHAFKDPATKELLTIQNATTAQVDATLKALGSRLGIDLIKHKTGSTIYPNKITGDGDTNLDPTDFLDVVPNEEPKVTMNRFREWLTSKLLGAGILDSQIKKGGDGLAVMAIIPGTDDYLQVDLDISTPGDGEFARWSRRGEPGKTAKGSFRHILKSAIARTIKPTLKWSFKSGLVDEETGEATKDPEAIAKILFGEAGKRTDLDNIGAIMKALKTYRSDIADEVIATAQATVAKMKFDYKYGDD
jgi:hypothetical protein